MKKNIGLVLCTGVIALFFCEILLRVIGYEVVTFYPLSGFHNFHAELGWSQIPNHKAKFQSKDFKITVETNSLGFRDQEHQVKKKGKIKRVLVIGDSFAWGWGVEQNDIFSKVAEREIDKTEFINLGTNGYGTDQEYILLKNYGVKLSPDLTVIAFFHNDIYDNYLERDDKPKFILKDGALILNRAPKPFTMGRRIKTFFNKHSLLFYFVDYRLALLKKLDKKEEKKTTFEEYFYRDLSKRMEEAFNLTLALLSKINEITKNRLLIMYIPSRLQVEKNTFRNALIGSKLDQTKIDLGLPNRRLKKYSVAHGVPFLDLTQYFKNEYEKNNVPLYFKSKADGHWTKEGHKLAGIKLKEKVQKLLYN